MSLSLNGAERADIVKHARYRLVPSLNVIVTIKACFGAVAYCDMSKLPPVTIFTPRLSGREDSNGGDIERIGQIGALQAVTIIAHLHDRLLLDQCGTRLTVQFEKRRSPHESLTHRSSVVFDTRRVKKQGSNPTPDGVRVLVENSIAVAIPILAKWHVDSHTKSHLP